MTDRPSDVAIIGMACIFPKAPDLQTYWQNIVSKVDAIGDPPEDWEADFYYDPDSRENDRIYCKRGGYLGDLARFDPLKHGIMPSSVDGGDPNQYLALRLAHEALEDAGYMQRTIDGERVEVIIGRGTYINRGFTTVMQHGLVVDQVLRILQQLHPEHSEDQLLRIKKELKASLPPFNAEMAPGLVPNLVSGRIANRLDFLGTNYTVDAACASALIAVDLGMQDLINGRCDLAVVGGVHVSTPAPILMIFCRLGALSRNGQIRPFDKDADGTLLGEGIGFVVLRRREDAERDRDKVYALIKGVGTSSDGRALGPLAPRVEGEELALRRAYMVAEIPSRTVELIEAHGTGTPVGDATEIEALKRIFGSRDGPYPRCALGSVKSMISHSIPAAGIAGLIKVALALYHKILPPTLNCDEPNQGFELEKTPFYINTEVRPWIHGDFNPRRAGVNAFGFGGVNAHAVLEEYTRTEEVEAVNYHRRWDTEVCILHGDSREELIQQGERLKTFLSQKEKVDLRNIAFTLNCPLPDVGYRLAIIASSLSDFEQKLTYVVNRLADAKCMRIKDLSGIYFFEHPLSQRGNLAFLFPGEGSQYLNMLSDLCLHFPEVRRWFDLIDRAFVNHPRGLLPSQLIFPPLVRGRAPNTHEELLWRMDVGSEAVFVANQALFSLLTRLGLQPQAMLGHSTGEYSALLASSALQVGDEEELMRHILELNRLYEHLSIRGQIQESILLTVGGVNCNSVLSFIKKAEGRLYLAMDNCPDQVVICGSDADITQAEMVLRGEGAICYRLPFARAYHTPLFQRFSDPLHGFFNGLKLGPPKVELYSCATARAYPRRTEEIRELAIAQWSMPVRFRETIEVMHEAGIRIFVEVGPRGNLTAFVEDILRGRPFLAVPSNLNRRSGITQLNHLVGLLAAHGVPLQLDYLYVRRACEKLDLDTRDPFSAEHGHRSSATMRLAMGLQPLRLRQGLAGTVIDSHHRGAAFQVDSGPDGSGQGVKSRAEKISQAVPVLSGHLPNTSVEFGSSVLSSPHSLSSAPAERSDCVELNARGDPPSQVMEEYFRTMEKFLDVQQGVMGAFISNADASKTAPRVLESGARDGEDQATIEEDPDSALTSLTSHLERRFPFIGTISSIVPGEELVAEREINLEEDIFLRHHTLGGQVSVFDDRLTALPIMPLTVSMEMLAQTAAMLMRDKRLIQMREVRAHRWVALDQRPVRLMITARRKSTGEYPEVIVQVRDITEASGSLAPLIIQGIAVFGDKYPSPPPVTNFPLKGARPSRWKPENLYTDGMFHGPTFQGVVAVDCVGQDGIEATLQVLPRDHMFRSLKDSAWVTDPLLLDAAGQLVGYWSAEHLKNGFNVFPFYVRDLQVYGPLLAPAERVLCRAQVRLEGDEQTRSDIDLVDSKGSLHVRLTGWEDRRFEFPDEFYQLRIQPKTGFLSEHWYTPIRHLSDSIGIACRLRKPFPEDFMNAYHMIWQRALAHLVLSRREREIWGQLEDSTRRRTEWLLGRIAAKDAVRCILKEHYGLNMCPADVEILPNECGCPQVFGPWVAQLGGPPLVSITHSDSYAAAVACLREKCAGIGLDMERLQDNGRGVGWLHDVMTREEQALFSRLEVNREEWLLRFWCAKEAVAKALGRGFVDRLRDFLVVDVNQRLGKVLVSVTGEPRQHPASSTDKSFEAYTRRESDWIVATSLYQRS